MNRELKGTVAWVTLFPCVCLGLPGQVNKFNSNHPPLDGDDDEYVGLMKDKFCSPCMLLDRCSLRMVN